MSFCYTENDVRDWINENISSLHENISNFEPMISQIEDRLTNFLNKKHSTLDLLNNSFNAHFDQKMLYTFRAFKTAESYSSLGTEYKLIDSSLRGKNPSADILAVAEESGSLAIIEVKISANAARQCVTELSAYANGLGGKFWGLSSFDSIWILINTDYKPTVINALQHQQLWADRCIVPLKADIETDSTKITNILFNIVDIGKPLETSITDSLFACSVIEGAQIYTANKVVNTEVALHSICSTFSNLGNIGFCFQHKATNWDVKNFPYPYGLFIATLNPFKHYLKQQQLEYTGVKRDSNDYKNIIDSQIWDWYDIDLADFTDFEKNAEELPYHRSLQDLAEKEQNSQYLAFEYALEQIRGMTRPEKEPSIELGFPDVGATFYPYTGDATYHLDNIEKVRYFGVLHEVALKMSENLQNSEPKFNEMALSDIYESPQLLFKLLNEVNAKALMK